MPKTVSNQQYENSTYDKAGACSMFQLYLLPTLGELMGDLGDIARSLSEDHISVLRQILYKCGDLLGILCIYGINFSLSFFCKTLTKSS